MASSTSNESSTASAEEQAIPPFGIEIPEDQMEDVRRRIAATRCGRREPLRRIP